MNNSTSKTLHTKTHGTVLYTHVSGNEQDKPGTSPETQRDACRAKVLSLPIFAEYYDGGIGGGLLMARTQFQAALSDIQGGRTRSSAPVSAAIAGTWSISRPSRRPSGPPVGISFSAIWSLPILRKAT